MDNEINLWKIAAILQSGVRDEADASEKYFDDIAAIKELASVTVTDEMGYQQPLLSADALAEIEDTYQEIIREELRHQDQFRELFTRYIGIMPMEH